MGSQLISSDDEVIEGGGGLDPRTGKIRCKAGPKAGFKREPHAPTPMDLEEAATVEYLRSMKLIRRSAPGRQRVQL